MYNIDYYYKVEEIIVHSGAEKINAEVLTIYLPDEYEYHPPSAPVQPPVDILDRKPTSTSEIYRNLPKGHVSGTVKFLADVGFPSTENIIEARVIAIQNPDDIKVSADSGNSLTQQNAGIMSFKTLHANAYRIEITDALNLITQYETSKQDSQNYFTQQHGPNARIDEHRLRAASIVRYPILQYHAFYNETCGVEDAAGNIETKINQLTELQYAYYRFILLLSDIEKNANDESHSLLSDRLIGRLKQAFPDLWETLNEIICADNLNNRQTQLSTLSAQWHHKLGLIERRLYIAMQERYLKQITLSIKATDLTDKDKHVKAGNLQYAQTHQIANRPPCLDFSPLDDDRLDLNIHENNNSIAMHCEKLKKNLEECYTGLLEVKGRSILRQFRKNRATYGLTRVLMLPQDASFFPVDQNTICLQKREGVLIAYWQKGNQEENYRVTCKVFPQTEIPYIMHILLPSPSKSSCDKGLIESVVSKLELNLEKYKNNYGDSHPQSNPSLFITINPPDNIESLSISDEFKITIQEKIDEIKTPNMTNYEDCLNIIHRDPSLSQPSNLHSIREYCDTLKDHLRGKTPEIKALKIVDEHDYDAFTEIFMLFKMLTKYLSDPSKKTKKSDANSTLTSYEEPHAILDLICKQLIKLQNISIREQSKSWVAMAVYNKFLNTFEDVFLKIKGKKAEQDKSSSFLNTYKKFNKSFISDNEIEKLTNLSVVLRDSSPRPLNNEGKISNDIKPMR